MNKNDLVILGLLSEKPKHGYEIIQDIKARGFEHWANINVASIYNHLGMLEEEGAIIAAVEKVGNMPERKVYTITESGKNHLAEQVVMAMQDRGIIEDTLSLGVAFMYGAEKKAVHKALIGKLELFKMAKKQIEKEYHDTREKISYNWEFLIRKTIDHFKVEIKYFRELVREVDKKDFLKRKGRKSPKAIGRKSK
jgi:DNA-binding PadR family transcriptional regulator